MSAKYFIWRRSSEVLSLEFYSVWSTLLGLVENNRKQRTQAEEHIEEERERERESQSIVA